MQIKSSQMLQPHRRLEEKFLRLKRELLKSGAMTVGMTENFVVPEDAAHFIPRLWEIGVDEKKLAQVLSKIYNRPIFSEKLEGRGYILKSSTEECPWVIVDDILYVTNPYDRNQIESLIRRNKNNTDAINFNRVGILAKSDADLDVLNKAQHDFSSVSEEKELFWATEFVDQILTEAIQRKASDIHINPESYGGLVKLRIDGRCEMVKTSHLKNIPREKFKLIANNLMERAGKQNNYLQPSSGYILFELAHKKFNFRLEMAPVKVFTERMAKITLRILNSSKSIAKLDQLGMSHTDVSILQSLSRRPNGMVVITGPTGSGKSTTLKMILRDIRDYYPEKTIFTIEDPVEEQIEGIVSLEVSQHMDFSDCLKSILRHDPDVIMIGEIRDQKTAELALRASMTGHLVFTTLHTNDAHGAICRLREFGLQNALIADNLLAVTAQRLINRVCPHCSHLVNFSDQINWFEKYKHVSSLHHNDLKVSVIFNEKGCDWCNKGYAGRQVIHEVLVQDFETAEMISQGLSSRKIRQFQLRNAKFKDMWDDGIRLIKKGVITFDTVESHLAPLSVFKGINAWPQKNKCDDASLSF